MSVRGRLIAFEGLDQSGKQTQAESAHQYFESQGSPCRLLSFPDYSTPIGAEIHRALHGEQDHPPDVMQLLYVANRYEARARIEEWLAAGDDHRVRSPLASSVAYGEAQGLDPAWLSDIQRFLPIPD